MGKITVTPEVITALREAVKAAGEQAKFSEISGIGQSRICEILKGKGTYIRSQNAKKLKPYLNLQKNSSCGVVQNNINGDNHANMLSDDDQLLLNWLNQPENRKIRLELLLKIEEFKNKN